MAIQLVSKGKTVREIVPRLADILEPLYLEVLATGKPIYNWELSGETSSKPGEIRDWQESFFPLMGEDGKPKAVPRYGWFASLSLRSHGQGSLSGTKSRAKNRLS